MNLALLIGLGAAVAVFLIFMGIQRTLTAGTLDFDARLRQYTSRPQTRTASPEEQSSALVSGMERAIAGRTFAVNLQKELSRADLKLTASEFLMLQGVAVLMGMLVLGLLGGSALFALGGAVVGFFFPKWYVGFRQGSRVKAFNDQLGDTITLLANSLRSGYSLLQSMEMAAREAPSPTNIEFQRVVREVGLGLSTEEALANLVQRMGSEDLDLMVTAINVQSEVGGNLAQILETIGLTIRERVRIKGEITTLTAQQTLVAYIISFLPVGLAGALYMLNKSYMMNLFKPGITLCLPICAGISIVVGFFAMQKLTEIEV